MEEWSVLAHLNMLKTTTSMRKISDVAMKRRMLVFFSCTQVCRRPAKLGRVDCVRCLSVQHTSQTA